MLYSCTCRRTEVSGCIADQLGRISKLVSKYAAVQSPELPEADESEKEQTHTDEVSISYSGLDIIGILQNRIKSMRSKLGSIAPQMPFFARRQSAGKFVVSSACFWPLIYTQDPTNGRKSATNRLSPGLTPLTAIALSWLPFITYDTFLGGIPAC
ncbi:unnamed protein product [Protopolystoma xenopodis]|uniref:Uncharacterized protein n=1 Tax=Protopolystoma xenopodis TaxID=117903 RepID=A0A3S5CVB7_9PLAT|nr:unnamed protein product [Protopolystoma xenopodis]